MRHLARKRDDMRHASQREQRADMFGKMGVIEQPVRHRLAAQHRLRESHGTRHVAHFDRQALAERRQLLARHRCIGRRIGERGNMHWRELRQRFEHMPAADPVAAVGRPWSAVHKEQDFGHQPRTLTEPARDQRPDAVRCP